MNETTRGNRTHIGIFGRTNSGKSSFINALTNQEISLVSDIAGTTTDPVYKSMEIHPIGPVVLVDTAGFDDDSLLGEARVKATRKVLDKTDVGVVLFATEDISEELGWVHMLQKNSIPVVALINKIDTDLNKDGIAKVIREKLNLEPVLISALTKVNIEKAREQIALSAKVEKELSIVGHLVDQEDVVMLVMPQDIQAPKGRLILPQVQTIRDLLDHRCIVVSATIDNAQAAIAALKNPPKLIISDSQVFPQVKAILPEQSVLTSFSVLFARYKGDVEIFAKGAQALGELKPGDRVLIAEACTHNPLDGDIGRIKIPKLIAKNYGEDIEIELTAGNNFPEDLKPYQLIIHCGSCMFNRKHVMCRIQKAQEAGVPITNYGLAIAYMNNMMDSVSY